MRAHIAATKTRLHANKAVEGHVIITSCAQRRVRTTVLLTTLVAIRFKYGLIWSELFIVKDVELCICFVLFRKLCNKKPIIFLCFNFIDKNNDFKITTTQYVQIPSDMPQTCLLHPHPPWPHRRSSSDHRSFIMNAPLFSYANPRLHNSNRRKCLFNILLKYLVRAMPIMSGPARYIVMITVL